MKFKEKFDFKNKIDFENFFKKFILFWQKMHIWFFAFMIVIVFIAGIFIWKKNLNTSNWDEAKKQEFLKAHDKNISLNEKEFNRVIQNVQERKRYLSDTQSFRNIFQSYK